MANLKSTTISDTGFLQLPTGTTAQRPASPTAGEIRFNTDTKVTEWYDDQLDSWFPTGFVPPIATGGDTVEDVNIGGVTYRIHSFTTVGESTFTVTRGGPVDYLIVAGGGGSGSNGGSGGGAGGFLQGTRTVKAKNYSIVVGNGGQPDERILSGRPCGGDGENTSAFGFTAIGGGGGVPGGSSTVNIVFPGGSGGGSSDYGSRGPYVGGSGTPGQGNKGADSRSSGSTPNWANGGGGGAGGPAPNVSNDGSVSAVVGEGGPGVASNISGTLIFRAGGGAGQSISGVTALGGIGGGGASDLPGDSNTGGGAGGNNKAGGSGIVIIRYRIS